MNVYLTIFGKPRYLGLTKIQADSLNSKWVILKTSRGYEMGLPGGMLTDEQQEKYKLATSKFEDSTETMLHEVEFVKEAGVLDIENYYNCKRDEERALLIARDILQEHKLSMKLVDVEYMFDRKKLYFYFTAAQRVDFRLYVRDLAREFRTRIEMRQVGIRDEARIVRGIASCGRPCCCSYWLRGFSPISIKIVKEQRSALNPIKISGLCGRLMCCMSYEKEYYSELWSKLPGPGAKIKTEQGIYILDSLELGNEHVNIRFPNGRLVSIAIAEFPDFKETVLKGEEWGEDKELAEKKKAAAARIAMLKERAERKREREKAREVKEAVKIKPVLKKDSTISTDQPKPNQKAKGNYKRKRPKNYNKPKTNPPG